MDPETSSRPDPDSGFRWIQLDLDDVLFLVRRHLLLLTILPLALTIVAMIVCFTKQPVFTSTAVIYLRPNFDREMLLDRSFSKLEDADSLRSVERAIISDTVILRMVDRLGLRDDESFLGEPLPDDGTELTDDALIKKIRKRYSTKLLPNTRLVELEVRDYSPERSKLVAETLIREFLAHLASERDIQEGELRGTLVTQANASLEEALASEKKLEEFRSAHPDLIVEQDSSVFQDRLLQYSQVLNTASSERATLEGMVAALVDIDPVDDPYRVFQILKNRNSEYLSELLGMHAGAKAEFASIGQQFTKEHPSYRQSEGRLKQVEETLRTYAEEMKSGLDAEFEAALRKEEKLQESLDQLQAEFVGFKSKSAEFRGLQEEIERNWSTYSQLQEKITNLDLNPENEFNFVTLISKPIAPDKKSHPATKLWMAASGFLGVILAGSLLLLRYRDGLPYASESQVGDDFGLANVTSLGSRGLEPDALARDPGLLDLLISLGNARIVQVASPSGQAESGQIATALATTFATRGQETLLVRLVPTEGPSENQVESTGTDGLSRIDLAAHRLLDPSTFRAGLEGALQSYSRVILDSSRLQSWEGLVAVGGEVERNLVLVPGRERSREFYRRFLDHLSGSSAAPVAAIYLEGRPSPVREQPEAVVSIPEPAPASPAISKRPGPAFGGTPGLTQSA